MSHVNHGTAGLEQAALADLVARVRDIVEVRDRRYGFPAKTYERCFVGSEAVRAMLSAGLAMDTEDAVRIGNLLLNAGVFRHVLNEHAFKNEHIYYRFRDDADHGAAAIRNALFLGRDKHTQLLVPWATYTDPEIAHVGLYARDLQERGIAYATFERKFRDVDRTLLEGETEGFVKIHVARGADKILGATIVGPHAGDMISEISVAMQAEIGLGRLTAVIHPYPTAAEAIRQCADAYNRTRLTPTVRKVFNQLMSLQR